MHSCVLSIAMTESDGENARALLDSLRRGDLSALLLHGRVENGVTRGDWGLDEAVVVVRAPHPFSEATAALPEQDRKRIAEAVLSRSDLRAPGDIIVKQSGDPVEGSMTLLPDLIIHREMMIDVSEGRKRIQEFDDYYGARQARLVEGCAGAGIKYENPHASLWDWYHFWKEQGWGSWAERRDYVRKLFAGPVVAAVGRLHNPGPVVEREPTGWERVDRSVPKARAQFSAGSAKRTGRASGSSAARC